MTWSRQGAITFLIAFGKARSSDHSKVSKLAKVSGILGATTLRPNFIKEDLHCAKRKFSSLTSIFSSHSLNIKVLKQCAVWVTLFSWLIYKSAFETPKQSAPSRLRWINHKLIGMVQVSMLDGWEVRLYVINPSHLTLWPRKLVCHRCGKSCAWCPIQNATQVFWRTWQNMYTGSFDLVFVWLFLSMCLPSQKNNDCQSATLSVPKWLSYLSDFFCLKMIVQFTSRARNLRLKVKYFRTKLSSTTNPLTLQLRRVFRNNCCCFILRVILTTARLMVIGP